MRKFLLVILVIIAFLFGISLTQEHNQPASPTPTPIPGRVETSSNLNLVRQWRYSFGSGCYLSKPDCLFLDDGRVILFYNDQYDLQTGHWDQTQAQIASLSLEDGKVIWQVPIVDKHWGTNTNDGLVNSTTRRLYLSFSYRVHAVNLDSGQILWSSEEFPTHNGYFFDPTGANPLSVYANRSNKRYELDPETGKVLTIQNEEMPSLLDQKWRSILFENNRIFVEGRILNLITAQNANGEEIWRGGDLFVSNLALIGERGYAIDIQGDLVAINARTGQRLGRMKFSPPLREVRPEGENGWSQGYFVFSQGPYLLITASDNHELLVYKEQ